MIDNINDKHTLFRKTSSCYFYDRNILAGSIPIFYDKLGINNTFYDYHPVTYHTQLVML